MLTWVCIEEVGNYCLQLGAYTQGHPPLGDIQRDDRPSLYRGRGQSTGGLLFLITGEAEG